MASQQFTDAPDIATVYRLRRTPLGKLSRQEREFLLDDGGTTFLKSITFIGELDIAGEFFDTIRQDVYRLLDSVRNHMSDKYDTTRELTDETSLSQI